jgi:hypothetical protein
MNFKKQTQQGVSLSGLFVVLIILAFVGLLAAKIVPTVTEYSAIKKGIENAKAAGGSVQNMQIAFDKQVQVSGIEAISSRDLEISKNGDQTEISFSYQKKIPLFGPASLVIDYAASTDKTLAK